MAVGGCSSADAPRAENGSAPKRRSAHSARATALRLAADDGTPSLRFGKNRRLLHKTDFDRVFADAEIKVHGHGLLLLARRNTLGTSRLGIVIGKRKVRDAAARNRLKRQIRESFRQRQFPALDVIALPGGGAGAMSRRAMWANLAHAWRQLRKKYR